MNFYDKTSLDIWKEFSKYSGTLPISRIYEEIKSDKFKLEVETIRRLKKMGFTEQANEIKLNILSFTTSVEFHWKKSRIQKNIKKYTGLMILEIDNLENEENVLKLFNKVISIKYTMLSFISPSGFGIKIVVRTNNSDLTQHTNCYKELVKYYSSRLEIKFDDKSCDVSRLCFFSYDPNAYFNGSSDFFDFEYYDSDFSNDSDSSQVDDFELQMKCVFDITSEKTVFVSANRIYFISLFARNSSLYGINREEVLDYCAKNFAEDGFDIADIRKLVYSWYSRNSYDFGKWRLKFKMLIKEKKKNCFEK